MTPLSPDPSRSRRRPGSTRARRFSRTSRIAARRLGQRPRRSAPQESDSQGVEDRKPRTSPKRGRTTSSSTMRGRRSELSEAQRAQLTGSSRSTRQHGRRARAGQEGTSAPSGAHLVCVEWEHRSRAGVFLLPHSQPGDLIEFDHQVPGEPEASSKHPDRAEPAAQSTCRPDAQWQRLTGRISSAALHAASAGS